jgi:hypothetical protein
MSEVFISHSHKDSRIALKIKNYLYQRFIGAFSYEADMKGGDIIWERINTGIRGGKYFMPLLSDHFVNSNPCMAELKTAWSIQQNRQLTIIPILLVDENKPNLTAVAESETQLLKTILQTISYESFDKYNEEKSMKKVEDAVWSKEKIRFYPVENKRIESTHLQVIQFEMRLGPDEKLPSDFLLNWNFDIRGFISESEKDDKPIKTNYPVALNGKAPNWLFAYLAIPFKNLRTVFLWNNVSKNYICIHSDDKEIPVGTTL